VIGPWSALSALREVVDLHERTSADVIAMLATGRVEARHVRCPELRLTIEPAVQDHRVHVELCGVRWRRAHLKLPTWLRLRRIVELPALPLGVVVVDARRRGDTVDLRLTVPSVSKSLSQPLLQGDPLGCHR
jgi:hypothetical protein